jgi:hypothetical protein
VPTDGPEWTDGTLSNGNPGRVATEGDYRFEADGQEVSVLAQSRRIGQFGLNPSRFKQVADLIELGLVEEVAPAVTPHIGTGGQVRAKGSMALMRTVPESMLRPAAETAESVWDDPVPPRLRRTVIVNESARREWLRERARRTVMGT